MDADSSSPHTSQLKTIVTLFVILRVTIVLMYTPQGLLNAYTDFQHYYRVAQLSDQGYYPYVNAWSEHPVLQTYTSQAIYGFVRSLMPMGDLNSPSYQIFARLLGAVMLIFETGVLILIHRIAAKTWSMTQANWLGWVYAMLSVPLFYWNASQTSNFVFFTLLAVYWFITNKRTGSAISLALGILFKMTPVFLLGSVARGLWPDYRSVARYTIIIALVAALIFAPFFLLGGGQWTMASLASSWARASWSTPWALIDGNWGVGDVGDVPARTQLDLAYQAYGNSPAIPSLLVLIAFAIIFVWLFRRPIDTRSPQQFIWFSTLTLMLFHLWSKGWSPQWALLIIPFMLLSFPNRRGLWLVLILTGLLFVEWPLADALQSRGLLVIAIAGRTALFIAISILTARKLWSRPVRDQRLAPIRASEDFIP
jgi:hypothetical protein